MKSLHKLLPVLWLLGAVLAGGCATHPGPRADYRPPIPQPQTPPPRTQGTIYHAGTAMYLFEDIKARRVGDIITIVLEERTQASKNAKTETDKETSLESQTPTALGDTFGRLGASVDNSTEFDGEGKSSQSNSLTGNISVTVIDVHPNGNLVVRGEKWLTLNQGDEYIQISGIVRPVDVRPDNTVPSTRVADARITYSGQGFVHDSNTMGWFAQFFNSVFWPF
ncbi:MAG: flagellar basal body L-ring protein FlgH [Gammaproteobacteria bacterium]|nr:flagellar basal body L-ring protein FlgH [Gammaproteobacteria bacterium]